MEKISLNDGPIKLIDKNLTLVIGTFDGTHLGHQKIFLKAREVANSKLGILVVDYRDKENISSIDDRFIKVNKFDFDYFVVFELNDKNKSLDANQFEEILEKLGCKTIVVGKDFCYGKNRLGNPESLKKKFNVFIENFLMFKTDKISSTLIKKFIKKGDVETANNLLGYKYQIKGTVGKGFGNGSSIGFPTLNIDLDFDYVLPKNGVYKTLVYILGIPYISLTNVGIHPTINQLEKPICETYVLNYDKEAYGKTVYLQFLERVRDEKKFDNIESLKNQIKEDIRKIK